MLYLQPPLSTPLAQVTRELRRCAAEQAADTVQAHKDKVTTAAALAAVQAAAASAAQEKAGRLDGALRQAALAERAAELVGKQQRVKVGPLLNTKRLNPMGICSTPWASVDPQAHVICCDRFDGLLCQNRVGE